MPSSRLTIPTKCKVGSGEFLHPVSYRVLWNITDFVGPVITSAKPIQDDAIQDFAPETHGPELYERMTRQEIHNMFADLLRIEYMKYKGAQKVRAEMPFKKVS